MALRALHCLVLCLAFACESMTARWTTRWYRPSCFLIRRLTLVAENQRRIQSFADFGVVYVSLDWPALTPALIEIRLFSTLALGRVSVMALLRDRGLPSWLFVSRRSRR